MENELIEKYKAKSILPLLDEVIEDLDLTSNYSYPALRQFLVSRKVCSAREFNRARSNAYVKSVLGTVPQNAGELIDAIVESYCVEASEADLTGLRWICPTLGTVQPCGEDDLLQEANRVNDTVLPRAFSDGSIGRAVRYWIKTHRKLDQQRRFDNLTKRGEFDWQAFAHAFFEEGCVSRKVQIAVMQKFIWQVKRRMAGLPITNHLMVVIYGVQGKGKSRALELLVAPLGHLVSAGDFQRLGDIREVAMFKSYVVVMDEMQKASQADVERVKNVITRDHFNYRPMNTNANVSTIQNAVFIGTSNRTLDQMILDPTGNRRFFQIDWCNTAGPDQWAYFNSLDIVAMWRSVNHLAEDPTLPFMDEIRTVQEGSAFRNTVGQFFDAVAEGRGTCTVKAEDGTMLHEFNGAIRKEDFYHIYRNYCDYMRLRSPLEAHAFYKEVRRIAGQEPDCPFEPSKTSQFNGWRYRGERASELIQMHAHLKPLTNRRANA